MWCPKLKLIPADHAPTVVLPIGMYRLHSNFHCGIRQLSISESPSIQLNCAAMSKIFPNVVPIVVSGSSNVVAEFPDVVPIVVSGSSNVVAEFPNVVPIVLSGSPNVVAEFSNVVPIVVSGSPSVVAEFPNVVPIAVSGSANVVAEFHNVVTSVVSGSPKMWWLNFPMWSPLWRLDLPMRWLNFLM